MQYILNETEFQAFQTLKEKNAELLQRVELYLRQAKDTLKERDERISAFKAVIDANNKKLASQAHELLVKEAELADLSGKLREAKRDYEGTSARLAETEKISAARLDIMRHLRTEIRRLKSEHVCVAQNPKTGTVRVISVVKADIYRKFGWTVSEEYLVDRPV